jgi:cytidylate kinase
MPIVTIARQLGAGGETIAQRLSDTLGWRLLDRALVDRIAEELEVAPEQVEATSERVEGFMERLGLYLAEGLPEALPVTIVPSTSSEATARAARRLVAALAEEGPAVIVGHGAMCVLRDRLDAMHVFVHAPFETRVGRAVVFFEVDREGAEEKIRRSDTDRKRYIREHFGREWQDPTNYHLCVDTGAFGIDGAVELIREAALRLLGEGHGAGGPG